MHRYIQLLIEQLREAHSLAPLHKDQNKMSSNEIMDELEEIDRIIDEEPETPMHNIFGIDPDMFPPVEKITKEQTEALVDEILELWTVFHLGADIPENFPKAKLYPLLVKKFREPIVYFPMADTDIVFCDYEPDHCPFGTEYCTCKDFIDEINKNVDPF